MNLKIQKKRYLKCMYRAERSRLLSEFKTKSNYFDKQYRKVKRTYEEELTVGIAESETKNPKKFWYMLKHLVDAAISRNNQTE